MNPLTKLAEFVAELRPEQIPEMVRQAAVDCVGDTVPVAIGAWNRKLLWQIHQMLCQISGNCEKGGRVWGKGTMLPLSYAVLMNGMAAHSLELDDVHTRSKTHIGAVVIPAAWTLAEYLGAPVEEFLAAVVGGYETMARVGMAFGVSSHRNQGWHATATAGTFGATAACARLLKLTPRQTLWALGLAGTQSSGVWAFLADGADNKILHTGRAAASGLEAALLAKAGMTGPRYIMEAADGGLFQAMTDAPEPEQICAGLGTDWEILRLDRKPYPCCRSTHCAIDGARWLKSSQRLDVQTIEAIRVYTYLVGNKQCGMSEGSRDPQTIVEARFSTPFTVASALMDGDVNEKSFSEERLKDETIRALLKKVQVITDQAFTSCYPEHWGCRVEVDLAGGGCVTREIRDASGSEAVPLTRDQLKRRAVGVMEPVLGNRAEAVSEQLRNLDTYQRLPEL